MSREASTQRWYQRYYAERGANCNDLRLNRGVLFQTLAAEASMVRACYAIGHDPPAAAVLDVGCGWGGDLYQLIRLKYDPTRITGIDIMSDRIAEARKLYPQMCFVQGDASRMEFGAGVFDLVFESTMFATLPDAELSAGIAGEMVRVCTPGGYLLLVDWRIPKFGDRNYRALTRRRLKTLFALGKKTDLLGTFPGALVPPLGRFLSKWLPGSYFAAASLMPFLVGQVAYLLRKRT